MKFDDLKIEKLEIPFKVSFSHSSATRDVTDSVIVTATGGNHYGYGEACPRSYVTDETFETVAGFFNRHRASIITSVTDLNSLEAWSSAHMEAIDQSPAAWCAIELALLDLLARGDNGSVENMMGLAEEWLKETLKGISSLSIFKSSNFIKYTHPVENRSHLYSVVAGT